MVQRAERRGRHADAAIDNRRVARADFGGKAMDDGGVDAAGRRQRRDFECPQRRPDAVPAIEHGAEPAGVDQSGFVERQQQRDQQRRVAARADEVMRIGDKRGFGAARIDDRQPAAARLQRRDALFDIGHRPDAAVRGQRVAADDDHVLRTVDIGDGEQRVMAEHQQLDELMRNLVDRRGRKGRPGADGLFQRRYLRRDAVIMRRRVAEVEPGLAAGAADGGHARGDFGIGGVPADWQPVIADPLDGGAQPVGIIFQIGERLGFGADMAARQRIFGIALDREDIAPLGGDDDAAIGFAQMAGAVVAGQHGSCPQGVAHKPRRISGAMVGGLSSCPPPPCRPKQRR